MLYAAQVPRGRALQRADRVYVKGQSKNAAEPNPLVLFSPNPYSVRASIPARLGKRKNDAFHCSPTQSSRQPSQASLYASRWPPPFCASASHHAHLVYALQFEPSS